MKKISAAILIVLLGPICLLAQSTIWFYRTADSPNPRDAPTVYENGGITRALATLKPGEFFGVSVMPGAYRYSYTRAPARGESVDVQVRPGEDVFIEVEFRRFRVVGGDAGRVALAATRPIVPDSGAQSSLVLTAPFQSSTSVNAPIEPRSTGSIASTRPTVAGEDPVRLYIYAARSVDGFIESTRVEDSAKDIRGAFKDKKSILLVDSADAADVTLEVKFSGYAPSGVKSETALRKGTFGGIDSTTTVNAVSLPAIGTILRVRGTEFEKEFSVMSQSFWKVLAGYVATNVDDWIKTNWRQLKEKTR